MAQRWRVASVQLPGIVPGAPRRNALVLIAYLFALFVATQIVWSLL